ncbi:MAG: L-threonylcarbamoyladenylate synthase [Candidatus Margulisiibacteriota bacterium]
MNNLVDRLINNQIGIIPHDTVPGIIARMSQSNAKRINQIKSRDENKGFIILIPNKSYLEQLAAAIPLAAEGLISDFWPGPLTLILKKQPTVPSLITGNKDTIAVRYPNHPLLNNILNELNEPIISTSANISGQTSISNKLMQNIDFTYGKIDQISNKTSASTIVDATQTPLKILRQGSITIPITH